MKLEIKDIINKHKNIPAIIIGHGPSLNKHIDILKEYKEKGYIFFGTNDWYNFYTEKPNYWVICNHIFSVSRNFNIMNNYNIPVIYSDVQELTGRNRIDSILKVDYLPYDFKHFNSRKCAKKWSYCHAHEHHTNDEVSVCCDHMIKGRLTVQEELQNYTNYSEIYGMGDANVMRQITFAILMGCNPIYLTGIDLDYRHGYAQTKYSVITPDVPEYQENIELQNRIHNDFRIINESAKNIGIKIINTNLSLPYNEFEKGVFQ